MCSAGPSHHERGGLRCGARKGSYMCFAVRKRRGGRFLRSSWPLRLVNNSARTDAQLDNDGPAWRTAGRLCDCLLEDNVGVLLAKLGMMTNYCPETTSIQSGVGARKALGPCRDTKLAKVAIGPSSSSARKDLDVSAAAPRHSLLMGSIARGLYSFARARSRPQQLLLEHLVSTWGRRWPGSPNEPVECALNNR